MKNRLISKIKRTGMIMPLILVCTIGLAFISLQTEVGNGTSSTEKKLESVLGKIDGAGDVRLMINTAEDGGIIGVCVLSTRAEDLTASMRIRRAVCTVLGVENERIEILKMEGKSK